ncbi:Bet1-like protein [Morus notabilis]|uniref:Bet1-like protein n=1 Tax=Morus notabilis TaxID=981085 RepID=W9R802_9ROSA|nr:Bet1-like protein [Morus notabilis]
MAAYGGAAPFRSREGLITRPVASSDEIQLRIDPMQGDLDDEITGLRSQVRRLRNVAEEIGTEARFQNDFLNQLATNDTDQSSSRGKEQRKEIEQKHHSEWLEQCCPCGSFRDITCSLREVCLIMSDLGIFIKIKALFIILGIGAFLFAERIMPSASVAHPRNFCHPVMCYWPTPASSNPWGRTP